MSAGIEIKIVTFNNGSTNNIHFFGIFLDASV